MTDPKMPFPYFGGKSQVAAAVWLALGDVRNYVEPFAGSCAVLLGRPSPVVGPETLNDYSCQLVNAIRAIRSAPEALGDLCVQPCCEVDTEAQHYQLVSRADELRAALGDPDHCDVRLAAWWIKGACEWIGGGWSSGEGPWQWSRARGWAKRNAGTGINRQLPHLGDAGTGVNRKLPHLGDAGTGVNRKLPHLGDAGKGERDLRVEWLSGWLRALSDRLVSVRVACGDFERVLGESVTTKHGLTGVFLDPPYDGTEYVYGGCVPVSQRVQEWCAAHGGDPKLRIVLAGRGTEHDPLGWQRVRWSARKGYANHEERTTEALWISPSCFVR